MSATPPPTTSSSTGAQGGLPSCTQMQAVAGASRDANNMLAGVCADKQIQCNTTCNPLISKYQTLANNSGDSDSQSIYSSEVQTLTNFRSQCGSLSAQLNNMTGQGIYSNYSANSGQNCSDSSGNGMNGATPQSANQPGASTAAAGGASGSAAQAAGASGDGNASQRGQAGMLAASPKSNQFNLGNNADSEQGLTRPIGGGFVGTPPKVNEIANNSGGGVGGGGKGPSPAGGGGGRGGAGSAGYSTDIDRGFRSGGGTLPTGGSLQATGGPGGGGSGNAGGGQGGAEKIDLRDFLPGGRRDPAMVNGLTPSQRESLGIQGRFVDIWERIHDRIVAKCKLGELYDCN